MEVSIITEQNLCAQILDKLGMTGKIIPQSNAVNYCAGFIEVSVVKGYFVLENHVSPKRENNFRFHLLLKCTHKEAWTYFDSVRKPTTKKSQPRLVFPDQMPHN